MNAKNLLTGKPLQKKRIALLMAFVAFLNTPCLFGQKGTLPYQSKMADMGEIQMEYMDFGGMGTPLIYVQDFHNYFEGAYKDSVFITFLANLSKETRVIAPLRRGYGKTTDTEWGYDVATQAEDLLLFMDAMGIPQAILLGRLPANQEMTWIAEHHPERLAGLIYWGNPVLMAGCAYPDELLLLENFGAMAPDFEKEKEKRVVMSRAFYRPHFLTEPNLRINVPALRIKSPAMENSSVLRRIVENGVLENLVQEDMPGYEQEQATLRTILHDSVRLSNLREHLIKCDPSIRLDRGMERTFSTHLKTFEKDMEMNEEGYAQYLDGLLQPISKFIKDSKH